MAAAQGPAAAYMNRYVIVVDEDVDPTNLEEVMWAVSTRCDPAEDIEIMRKSWGSKVDPLLTNPEAPAGLALTVKDKTGGLEKPLPIELGSHLRMGNGNSGPLSSLSHDC